MVTVQRAEKRQDGTILANVAIDSAEGQVTFGVSKGKLVAGKGFAAAASEPLRAALADKAVVDQVTEAVFGQVAHLPGYMD